LVRPSKFASQPQTVTENPSQSIPGVASALPPRILVPPLRALHIMAQYVEKGTGIPPLVPASTLQNHIYNLSNYVPPSPFDRQNGFAAAPSRYRTQMPSESESAVIPSPPSADGRETYVPRFYGVYQPPIPVGDDTFIPYTPEVDSLPPSPRLNENGISGAPGKFRPENSFSDGSGAIFSFYTENAEKEDDKMAESWKGDADGILVFTGLFSATVATLLGISL
ncbi:hypothetical protein BC834DRAFT_1016182, partial [Gloeopeniophorella convolvens]